MAESGALTQQQAFALLERTTDPGWLAGMRANPDGLALLNAMTAIHAAASETVMEQAEQTMIDTASAGSVGTCQLTIHGPGLVATIPNGVKFRTGIGIDLVLPEAVAVGLGQTTIVLDLVTLRQLDLVNTVDPAFDDALSPGETLDGIMPDDNLPSVDWLRSYAYASSTAISGASMDWLSQHGAERGCFRQPGEDGELYRARVLAIPDAVSPKAIAQAVSTGAAQAGLGKVYIVEPYPDQASSSLRTALNLAWADTIFCDVDFADDPHGVDDAGKSPFQTLECASLRTGRAYFRIALLALTEPDASTFYCDDDGYCDDELWGYPDMGLHPALTAALGAIAEAARVKRGGGISTDFYVENASVLTAEAVTPGVATSEVAWTLNAPGGTAWMIRAGLLSGNTGSRPMLTTETCKVRFTLADASTITIAGAGPASLPLRKFDLERGGYRGQLVTKIEGIIDSNPAAAVDLCGTFWATAVPI